MSDVFEALERRIEDISISEIFERPARNWDDVEEINLVAQSTACALLELCRELKDIKEELKTVNNAR